MANILSRGYSKTSGLFFSIGNCREVSAQEFGAQGLLRLQPRGLRKPDTLWYDLAVARREVKRVASTRSGQGRGGSHANFIAAANVLDSRLY